MLKHPHQNVVVSFCQFFPIILHFKLPPLTGTSRSFGEPLELSDRRRRLQEGDQCKPNHLSYEVGINITTIYFIIRVILEFIVIVIAIVIVVIVAIVVIIFILAIVVIVVNFF